ncbi:L-serine ammonia-lyase, iron-sulfur-dependent, subunit alpha, partial [Bacteroides mediterraneensis]
LLGLVCDPVGGLVEVPCQARNAIGVAAAFSAAQLALSGVRSLVPFDEVVRAMAEVGRALPATLRETAAGGLAATPSARAACTRCAGCA